MGKVLAENAFLFSYFYTKVFTSIQLTMSGLNIVLVVGSDRKVAGGTVILNVGGTVHQVRWETIDKFPRSRLQRLRYASTQGEICSLKQLKVLED